MTASPGQKQAGEYRTARNCAWQLFFAPSEFIGVGVSPHRMARRIYIGKSLAYDISTALWAGCSSVLP